MRSVRGRVWVFGNDLSTDLILPGSVQGPIKLGRAGPETVVSHCLRAIRPGWHVHVRPGDIIVGGRNFGCGSSRPAHLVLQAMGIGAVVAESVARLFFRNCINAGLVAISCPSILDLVAEGDELELNLVDGIAYNLTKGSITRFAPLPEDSPPSQILRAGGLIPYMEQVFGGAQKGDRPPDAVSLGVKLPDLD
ncbi:MAG: 3-isopropylmalate dehydratase [Bacillota bacterium]|nr:3-isopropylmalate dehydratase [Bacillota bacterium]